MAAIQTKKRQKLIDRLTEYIKLREKQVHGVIFI